MYRSSGHWVSLFVFGATLGFACADEKDCTPGAEGCVCNEGACLEGLSCLSDHCVDPNWVPPTAADGDGGDGGDGGSADNVAACEALLDEIACGEFDLSMFVDCSVYADLGCDIADYFDCVRDVFVCTDGVADASGLTECAEMATCA